MGKYMKMSDYFVGDMLPEDIVILDGGVATIIYTSEEAAAHAINSHDELVAEVERLRSENESLMKCLMAAREFFNCTVASGVLVKVSSSNKAALNEADKASDCL